MDEIEPEVAADVVVDATSVDGGQVVDAASVDSGQPVVAPAPKKPQYLFPRKALEDAIRVPTAIRTSNGGNPWAPGEIAKALGIGAKTGNYFYLTAASRDFGLTEGTRDSATISLTALGKRLVYPTSDDAVAQAKLAAFLKVDIFRKVAEHYGGSKLPADEFVFNTLETQFAMDPRTHAEFIDLFHKNCKYVGIGNDWKPNSGPSMPRSNGTATTTVSSTPSERTQVEATGDRPVCFVIMPFVERSDDNSPGFFAEVFAYLFKPAIEMAGFEARTAKRQGSDVIQATIVNELLDADLVLCDLTEHNPNVLFELGLRMAGEKPIAIVKATGTNPIFDVDHLLRVESYNPNLWPSTVDADVPRLTEHIKEAWATRSTGRSYMSILRQAVVPA